MAVKFLDDPADLEAIYGAPVPASLVKVADHLTPEYRTWIMASRFCILSTVGPDGTDATPRGDDGPVVAELDAHTLALPDWAGNNRIDSLRNLIADPRCSLLFMVPGSNNVVRINGSARITADDALRDRFARAGKRPRTVLVIAIAEVYVQCAKALMRSGLWEGGANAPDVPSVGTILKAMSGGTEGGAEYDKGYAARAARQLWVRE
ncbi:MAG: pyridoxamine 5'-phosphate oxidase family protein [Rhodobacteraceae bacterium]|nr:pyridoxamine 5'-phosphate oxidase family protein [Paracoccaceae bacterium]